MNYFPLKSDETHNCDMCYELREVAWPQGYKSFSCSSQLSTKFSLLINMKMPTIVGIFIFISREICMLSYVKQERMVCTLRFISWTNFMLSSELSTKKVL